MNILVLSNMEWSDNNAFGNTISNLFLNLPDTKFASIYRRNSMPNNQVCNLYYRLSYTDLLKNVFSPSKIGRQFTLDDKNYDKGTTDKENKLISIVHKFKLVRFVHFIENILFITKIWNNDNFKNFINDFNPDIVFDFTCTLKATELILREIKKIKPNCKLVTFITDDVHKSNKSKTIRSVIKYQMENASKIYAITPALKEEYERIFNVDIDILRKGCYFNLPVIKKENKVKTIVYAGNLLYERDKTLIRLAEELYNHNLKSENKIKLYIYSPTYIDEATKSALNKEGASEFMGGRNYEEIVNVLNKADIVLHVESFDKKQQEIVKNSFSTKIIDALQSGSVLFSIGAKGLSSIDITSEIPGTFVANSLDEICYQIENIAVADLYKNANSIRAYAVEHFAIEKIQQKLVNDFKQII